ncbi:unnamed protein product, partial [Prorocentrum cordatum]
MGKKAKWRPRTKRAGEQVRARTQYYTEVQETEQQAITSEANVEGELSAFLGAEKRPYGSGQYWLRSSKQGLADAVGRVGGALTGQTDVTTIDGALKFHANGPMQPFVGDHGLTAFNFSQQTRESIKLPSTPPAAPRASDMAGQCSARAAVSFMCSPSGTATRCAEHSVCAWSNPRSFDVKRAFLCYSCGECGIQEATITATCVSCVGGNARTPAAAAASCDRSDGTAWSAATSAVAGPAQMKVTGARDCGAPSQRETVDTLEMYNDWRYSEDARNPRATVPGYKFEHRKKAGKAENRYDRWVEDVLPQLCAWKQDAYGASPEPLRTITFGRKRRLIAEAGSSRREGRRWQKPVKQIVDANTVIAMQVRPRQRAGHGGRRRQGPEEPRTARPRAASSCSRCPGTLRRASWAGARRPRRRPRRPLSPGRATPATRRTWSGTTACSTTIPSERRRRARTRRPLTAPRAMPSPIRLSGGASSVEPAAALAHAVAPGASVLYNGSEYARYPAAAAGTTLPALATSSIPAYAAVAQAFPTSTATAIPTTTTETSSTTTMLRSLFCFALMMPSGDEVSLMRELLRKSQGIFLCDSYSVFSSEDVELSAGPPARIGTEIIGSPAER